MDAKATGALIAQRRKQLALSQAELAERLHVTDKAVSRWETGRGMPGLDSLEPLSEALGLSVSEVLSGKELTSEELPRAAGGQIMESMKREHTWKWLAWLAMALVTVLAVWGASVSRAQTRRELAEREQAEQERWERYAHYTSSVNPNEEEDVVQATVEYFEERGARVWFEPGSLRVREHCQNGDYLAFLLSDREGEWCMSLWQRDAEYPQRYCIMGGRHRVEPGVRGLRVWNFGDAENAVVVVSGAELPEEAVEYAWDAGGVTYMDRVGEDTRTVLNIFLVHLPESDERPFYKPIVYSASIYDSRIME